MQITSISKTGVADCTILQLMIRIDRKTPNFGDYYYIHLCIIKEQSSDQEDSKWKGQKGCQNNVNDGLCQNKLLHIVDTAVAKWASTEHQQLLVIYVWYLKIDLFIVMYNRYIVTCYRKQRKPHSHCPILRMSMNGVSKIFSFTSRVIDVLIGCRHPFMKYWQPLQA